VEKLRRFMICTTSPNIICMMKSRRMRWVDHEPHMGDRRRAYMVLVRRPEGKKPLGRHRYRWENNSKMDLQEVGWGGIDWIISLRTGTGTCECGNERASTVNQGDLLD
jgi:hypothetical protein